MKKILISLFVITIVLASASISFANNEVEEVTGFDESKVIEVKKSAERELKEYTELYGTETYGMAAYILNKVRIYSIPFCFVGIALGAIYQYTIGIRKLDVRDKGFKIVIMCVSVLVICQILPLIFAIVIRGWRS